MERGGLRAAPFHFESAAGAKSYPVQYSTPQLTMVSMCGVRFLPLLPE
jgi:hypothetical protein